jgi:hypothetical protein
VHDFGSSNRPIAHLELRLTRIAGLQEVISMLATDPGRITAQLANRDARAGLTLFHAAG